MSAKKRLTARAKWEAINHPSDSVAHLIKLFLSNRTDRGLSPQTVNRLYYNLRPLADHFEHTPAADIKARDLIDYQKSLWRQYADDTIRVISGDIRQLFRWSKKRGRIPRNPSKRLKAIRVKPHRRQVRAADESDVLAAIHTLSMAIAPFVERDLFGNLAAKDGIDPWVTRDLFALVFLYETGARVGELAGLGSRPMANTVKKRQDVYRITVVGKTGDCDRWFTQSTADLWHLWQQVRPAGEEHYALVGWRWPHTVSPLKPHSLTEAIQNQCRKRGLQPFTTKALRHAKIKRARTAGGIEMAQTLIDHADLKTTMNYDWGSTSAVHKAALETGVGLIF